MLLTRILAGTGLALALLGGQPATAAAAPPLSGHDLAIARDAFLDVDRGQFAKAEALAATADDKLPLKIITWMDYLRPQSGHRFDELATFIDDNPDWPLLGTLRLRVEDILADVSDATARAWFARHPPISPFARLRQAELLMRDGHGAEATALIRDTWVNGDFGAADEKQVTLRFGSELRTEDDIARLDRLLWEGKTDDARRMLPHVPSGWRLLADARLKLAASARTADAAVARVPASLAGDPGLAFERMRYLRRKNKDDAALAIIEHQTNLKRPETWWPDRQILARRLIEQGQAARAYQLIADHQLHEPAAATEAEFTAGWIALRFLKDPAKAAPHFARLMAQGKLPVTLSRGAYWAGRAADALGKPDEAVAWYTKAAQYNTTYYGQLAAAMPGVTPLAKPEPEPKATPAEAAVFEHKELVRAMRILIAIDQQDRMRPFLYKLAASAQTPADYALLADFAEDIGRPDLGVAAAKHAANAGINLLRAGYPVVWVPRNAGTEQALLLALIRQESAFDLHAMSPTGARGLMQLMPGTAAQVAKSISVPFADKRLMNDGVYNVTLGQAYFDGLVADFNGSYVLAVAAYNAGPGSVQKWIDEFGDPRTPDVDVVDWVESIPYGETRNYVQRVLENLQVYRLRIGDRSLAFSLEADLRR